MLSLHSCHEALIIIHAKGKLAPKDLLIVCNALYKDADVGNWLYAQNVVFIQ